MRKVYIRHEPQRHSIFVVYFTRTKYTRHLAAQFDDRVKTIEEVEQYVRAQNTMQLVCAISGKYL